MFLKLLKIPFFYLSGGGEGKKAKKLPGLSICICHNHPNTYAMILITGSHL